MKKRLEDLITPGIMFSILASYQNKAVQVNNKLCSKAMVARNWYEFHDGSSAKFWSISIDESSYTVRYGKVGSKGQTKTKSFKSPTEASAAADKVTAQKLKKGYKPSLVVDIPILGCDIPVELTDDNAPIDYSHPMFKKMPKWTPPLKAKIEKACFRHYRDMVEMIGDESLPKIAKPGEIWPHIKINSIRLDPEVPNVAVAYVVPAWDLSEHMEWAIKGTATLQYAGTFLCYPVDSYADQKGFE